MNKLQWGILGTARINRSLIPPLRLSYRNELRAVASRTLERAEEYAHEWDIPEAIGSYDALLAHPDIDAIYIPLPNSLHAEWTIKAAQAGKHVLCEKPLALSVEEVDAMITATEKSGTVLIEAFMYRFHARTLHIKEMINTGVIGDVHHIKGAFTFPLNRPGDVRWDADMGGGSLWDVGCYPLNFSRYLLGTEPIHVYGHSVNGDSGIDLSFTAQLLFPGDISVQFDCGFRSQFRMHMEITGDKGSIFVPMAFKPGQRSYIHVSRGNNVEYIAIDGNLLYMDEVEHMVQLVHDGAQPILPLTDSRANIHAIRSLYESAQSGEIVHL